MARLPDASGDGAVADRIRGRRGGDLRPIDLALLHSPPVADGWNTLLGAVRGATTLPDAVREAVVLRVAWLNGAEYEWRAHEPLARRHGLGDLQLAALRADPVDAGFDERLLAVLGYTDAMTRAVTVPDEVFATVRAYLDDRQLVELTATVAAYNMVSRFLVALHVGDREDYAGGSAGQVGDAGGQGGPDGAAGR